MYYSAIFFLHNVVFEKWTERSSYNWKQMRLGCKLHIGVTINREEQIKINFVIIFEKRWLMIIVFNFLIILAMCHRDNFFIALSFSWWTWSQFAIWPCKKKSIKSGESVCPEHGCYWILLINYHQNSIRFDKSNLDRFPLNT